MPAKSRAGGEKEERDQRESARKCWSETGGDISQPSPSCFAFLWTTSGGFTQPGHELGWLRLSFQEKFSFQLPELAFEGNSGNYPGERSREKVPEEGRPIETEYGPHRGALGEKKERQTDMKTCTLFWNPRCI